ncbi:hypothetical protein Dda_2018 [Drechslerella dactyloides]|uniref:Uncharacterized protein n=1 Tax=Drechslerella dactyloides TaxID=74499 RepID=A0AAD6NM07_DREDA|nr:hypothetical protein Dda_2018 [Drechslerella dactyloides]
MPPIFLNAPKPRDAAQQAEWDRIGNQKLAEDTARLKHYIQAMEADTARHKDNWQIQKFIMKAAVAYAGESRTWEHCNCQFCIEFRYFRESNGIEGVGSTLWNDPLYSAGRKHLDRATLEQCPCSFCKNLAMRDLTVYKENYASYTTASDLKQPIYYEDSLALDPRATAPGFSPPERNAKPLYNVAAPEFYPSGNTGASSSYSYTTPATYSYNDPVEQPPVANYYQAGAAYDYTSQYTAAATDQYAAPATSQYASYPVGYNEGLGFAQVPVGNYQGDSGYGTASYPTIDSEYAQTATASSGSGSDVFYPVGAGAAKANRRDKTVRPPPGLPVPSNRQRMRNQQAYDRGNGGNGGGGGSHRSDRYPPHDYHSNDSRHYY